MPVEKVQVLQVYAYTIHLEARHLGVTSIVHGMYECIHSSRDSYRAQKGNVTAIGSHKLAPAPTVGPRPSTDTCHPPALTLSRNRQEHLKPNSLTPSPCICPGRGRSRMCRSLWWTFWARWPWCRWSKWLQVYAAARVMDGLPRFNDSWSVLCHRNA